MFKVLKGGCDPTKGTKYSACVDLYASEDVAIGAGETKLVGLGVAIDLDMDTHMGNRKFGSDCKINANPTYGDGAIKGLSDFKLSHYLQLMLRSSLGKEGLIIPNGVGIIDMDYNKEIKVIIHNPKGRRQEWVDMSYVERGQNEQFFEIKKGDRIAQITLLEHKSYLFGIESDVERDGGFGSTDS